MKNYGASIRFSLRYIRKRIFRSLGKSGLTVLFALLLLVAVGQLKAVQQAYADVFSNTLITSRFVGGPQLTQAKAIGNTSYVTDPYYISAKQVDLNFVQADFIITNNISRFGGEEPDITYAEGYDETCLDMLNENLIVGAALMAQLGIELGDTVVIASPGFLAGQNRLYIIKHRGEFPEDTATDHEILELYRDQIAASMESLTHKFTVAGAVSSQSGSYDKMVFSPGSAAVAWLGLQAQLDMAEFTLADNSLADEYRAYCDTLRGGSATGSVTFIMDTSKLESPRNALSLLAALYPAALAAALLIGAFLCCLTVLQSSKEAAIMRVLGTTKRKTRIVMSLEQCLLGVAGLVLGGAVLLAVNGQAMRAVSGQMLLFAALYFGVVLASAVICSVLATRRSALELLQVRE